MLKVVQTIPEVFHTPKELGEFTPETLEKRTREQMKAIGLGRIAEEGASAWRR